MPRGRKPKTEIELALDQAEALVTDTLTGARAELDELNAKIAEQEQAAATAEKDQEAATIATDPAKYQKAKERKEVASDTARMYRTRRDMLERGPLITEAEYNKAINGIHTEFSKMVEATKKDLARLSTDMLERTKKLEAAQARANLILHQLQYDLYKCNDDAPAYDTEGRIMRTYLGQIARTHTEQQVNAGDVINWGTRAARCQTYIDYTGRRI